MSTENAHLTQIENRHVSLAVDAQGRLVSLRNKLTRTELVTHPAAAEAWRMVLPVSGHVVDFVYGSQQTPTAIEIVRRLNTAHGTMALNAGFVLALDGDAVVASVELDNKSARTIDEVEFPVIGGMGGYAQRGKQVMNLVVASDNGAFYEDVINHGLPFTGRESDQFVRELETAMFEPALVEGGGFAGTHKRGWLDLWSERQGLYVAYRALSQGSPQCAGPLLPARCPTLVAPVGHPCAATCSRRRLDVAAGDRDAASRRLARRRRSLFSPPP
jgi:hypothetical protein